MDDVAEACAEIRPKGGERPRSAGAIVGWTGFTLCSIVAADGKLRIVNAGVAVVCLFVGLAVMRRWRRRAVLSLSDDSLTYTGIFARRVISRRPFAGRAVVAGVRWVGSGRRSRRWLLLDAGGEVRLALDLVLWDLDDLHALTDRLGIRQEMDPALRRPADLRRAYPGSVHWLAAHPLQFTFLLIAAVSIVLAALGVQ